MVTFSSVAPDHVACGLGGIAAGVLILLHGSLSWLSRLVRFVKMKSREHASSPGGAGLTAFVMSGKNSAMRRLRKSRLDLPAHTTNGLGQFLPCGSCIIGCRGAQRMVAGSFKLIEVSIGAEL